MRHARDVATRVDGVTRPASLPAAPDAREQDILRLLATDPKLMWISVPSLECRLKFRIEKARRS